MTSTTRRDARALLLLSFVLFGVFGYLLFEQLKRKAGGRFTPDRDLMQELASATLVEEQAAATTDWPQWLGPDRDGVTPGEKILTSWPSKGPPLLWQKPIGESYSAFVVVDGRLYTLVREGGQEVALCWNLDDGHENWRYAYDCPYQSGQGSGPRSTPCFADGKLYTVGASGLMHCLDAANGKVVWQHDLLKEFKAPNLEWGVSFSPLVDGNLVITSPGGASNGSLVAFDKETGNVAWQALGDHAGYSSPVALTIKGKRQLVCFTGAGLVGVAADSGKLFWRLDWETSFNVNAATPLVMHAQKDGEDLHYVFISSDYGKGCALLKIAANGIQTVYQGTQMKNHFSTSVRRGDHLFGFDDSNLVCMNWRTGEAKWKKSGFAKGSLLRIGDYLIVLGERGKLALAEANPESYEEKASFQALKRRCWTAPVIADGRLLVRDEEQVKCFDLRGK